MKNAIQIIELFRVAIPFETHGPRHGLRPGLPAWTRHEALLVKVTTRDGMTGWGEAYGHFINPTTAAALQTMVAPWFLGKDAGDVAQLMARAEHAFYAYGRNGPVKYALSGIDIALWDIIAKRAGLPLYKLLGGDRRLVDTYASFARYGDPEAIARNTAQAVQAGFKIVKLHETEVANFRAAQEAAGGRAGIALDVNCPWTVNEARNVAQQIAGQGYAWLEEPVWPPEDFDGMAEVRRAGTPVAAGENIQSIHDFKRLFQARAVDFVQPSAYKVGGVSALRQVFALADAFSVTVVPHSYSWGPSYLATAHVIAAQARPATMELAWITLDDPVEHKFDSRRPQIELSDQIAGVGFEPDAAALARQTVWSAVVE